MKHIFAIVLAVIILIVYSGNISYAYNNTNNISPAEEQLLLYIKSESDDFLISRSNYQYMVFVEDFKTNPLALYFLKMSDIFVEDVKSEPDTEKYIDILTNIIVTYDLDNSSKIADQKNLDNLKNLKDYAMDFAEMGNEIVSVITGNEIIIDEQLETYLAVAMDGVFSLSENTDNWIETLNNLETILQNYSKYDEFLALIEDESEGNLKEAASVLRKGMLEAMQIRLETYAEITNENFERYSEFFFDNALFPALKQIPQYRTDENLKYFVDSADNFISNVETLKSSWNLGTLIGKTVGNVVVGGEDLINRTLEMMALYDVSVILQEKILNVADGILDNLGSNENSEIEQYILYSQYLIDCRIRGEYCLYSVVAENAGLLSWFKKKDAEQAREWYERKTNMILDIHSTLLALLPDNESNETLNFSKEDLKQNLINYTSDPILNFIYEDFDNNGVYEAVAFCGEEYEDGSYAGTLYFISKEGVKEIRERDYYWNIGKVYDFGNAKIISITKYFTTGGISFYYEIKNNDVVEIDGSGMGDGLFQDEDGRICMTDSQYDAFVDGTGHTWNVYYFYWDNGLKEYGGTSMSVEDFSLYEGSDNILKQINEDGYDIISIFKRQNNIININCCDGWSNSNVRVLLENNNVKVLPITEGYFYEEGIIKQALIPQIATY